MFAQTWRKHWGLVEDPFAYEDADKDPVLERVEVDAVHSSFDRIFGNVAAPGPGIVFGEKGSGKSGLRHAIVRRLQQQPNEGSNRIFYVEYVEFDHYLDNLRAALRLPPGRDKTAGEVADRIRLADHLDAMLSLCVTAYVDQVLDRKIDLRPLEAKHRLLLELLCALYYDSRRRTLAEASKALRQALHTHYPRPMLLSGLRLTTSIAALALALTPSILGWIGKEAQLIGPAKLYWGAGAFLLLATWVRHFLAKSSLRHKTLRALSAVRVLTRDSLPLHSLLEGLRPDRRKELVLPGEGDEAGRYEHLSSLLQILRLSGYSGCYILMDRVDESTLFAGKSDWIRPFVARLLDHRLLQFPGLALKLFLPVELAPMYLGASPEELKRMRLDKSNTVQELRWTGQELLEIANKRLAASRSASGNGGLLQDYFRPDVPEQSLVDTLAELGTPRYAFGFLSELFREWIRNLPDQLEADAPDWKIPRAHYDLTRSAWTNRTRVLRRALN